MVRMPFATNRGKLCGVVIPVLLIMLIMDVPLTFSESPGSNETLENSVQISKSSTSSYGITNGQTVFMGPFFDTSYIITGNAASLNKSKDLVVSTIRDDFIQSPTIGYIASRGVNGANQSLALPNPFVGLDVVNKTITQKLSTAFNSVNKANYSDVTIKCVFDMDVSNWKCNAYGFVK